MTASPHKNLLFVGSEVRGQKSEPGTPAVTRPLIFVSVGTDHHPFDRLVQWADRWSQQRPDVEVVIQHGEAARPVHAGAVPYLSHSELSGYISRAVVVVSHGGPATIAEAWRAGLTPVVAPRGRGLGEHVDDHQQAFAAVLAARHQVVEVKTEGQLGEALNHALSDPEWLRREPGGAVDVDASVRNFSAVVAAVTSKGGRRSRAAERRALRRIGR